MQRRQFLAHAFAAAAASFLPSAASAAESAIDLGFSLYGMKSLALDEALRTCAEIGYRNVELSLLPGFPTEPKQLDAAGRHRVRESLDQHRLHASALMVNVSVAVDDAAHQRNLETIKEAAQLAHDLYPDAPPVVETVFGGKPADWDAKKEQFAERLHDWASAASAGGISLAVKAHVSHAVNSPERLLWLIHAVNNPSIVVAYDYSHYELAGLSMEETLRELLPLTRFIHVKDTTGDSSKFKFLLPGQGRTDYAAYFSLLAKLGYQGPVVVEVSAQIFNQPGYDPVAAARQSYASLSKFAAR